VEKKTRILLVEDEVAIRTGLVDVFVFHGYDVDFAEEGREGLRMALSGHYDLILLDIMLPGMDGYEICRRIREQDKDLPIIMLTAKTGDEEIIQGLALGADDYVAKPFSVAQLVLRVQAVLRRSQPVQASNNHLRFKEHASVDLENLSGQRGSETLAFTRREVDVLQYLGTHANRPVSREELLNKVWGYDKQLDIETRTVDIHIAKLRRKIEANPKNPQFLITVRGAGYRLLLE
jgi:two-component system alkaline phosphatase synthesis response regulator PhoP